MERKAKCSNWHADFVHWILYILQTLGGKTTYCANCQETQCLLCMPVLLWSQMGVWWCNCLQKQVAKLDNECMGEVYSVGLPCCCCLRKASCFNLPQESESSAQWARGQLERRILGLAWQVKSKSTAASWVTVHTPPSTQLNAVLPCTKSV